MADDAVAAERQRIAQALADWANRDRGRARSARVDRLRRAVQETGEALGISPATVKTDWATAKLWLHNELSG